MKLLCDVAAELTTVYQEKIFNMCEAQQPYFVIVLTINRE